MATGNLKLSPSLREVIEEDILKQISSHEEEPKPFYYSDQIRLSNEIIERLELILDTYHSKKIEDFSEFDFQIYTAKSNTLKEQTRSRIEPQLSGCIPAKLYDIDGPGKDKELRKYTDERVCHYVISRAADERHEALLQEAEEKQKKLFLIIADEAHWGLSDESDNEKTRKVARVKYVDCWSSEIYKNVFVLLVSATPYNLLTEETLLPLEKYCAKEVKTRKLIVVQPRKDSKGERLWNSDAKDVTSLVGPKKRMHHVRWTEISTSKLNETMTQDDDLEEIDEEGEELTIKFIMRSLVNKSTEDYKDPVYLMPQSNSLSQLVPFVGVPDITGCENKAMVTVKGNTGKVRMFDSCGRLLIMKYKEGNCEFDVGFMKKEDFDQDEVIDFEMSMDYGEDIFCLFPIIPAPEQKLSLYFNVTTGNVHAHIRPDPRIVGTYGVLTILPARDLFLIHDRMCKPRYMSLNFYHSTMWNTNRQERLIRYDEGFEKLCSEVSSVEDSGVQAQDDILIAEYCIFINAMVIYNELQIPDNVLECTGKFLDTVKSFTIKIKQQLTNMEEKLPEDIQLGASLINRSVFKQVLKYHRERQPSDIWKQLFTACLLGNEEILDKLLNDKEMFHKTGQSPDILKQSVVTSYDTAKIVQDLLNFDSKNMQGKMQVIRVCREDKRRQINFGKRWYDTLTLARNTACPELYLFEVLRDFGGATLNETYSKNLPEKRRLHLLIQRSKCSESCRCYDYRPTLSRDGKDDAHCQVCRHYHNNLKILEDLDKLPCILILVEKGKLGDTFPASLRCLDLRVRRPDLFKKVKDPQRREYLELSTLVQGMGRLCRYSTETDLQYMPYALVSKEKANDLKICVKNCSDGCGTIYSSFYGKGNLDSHTTTSRPKETENVEEGTQTFLLNSKNPSKQHSKEINRILLDAEPQCGKTGTFCHVISQLRKSIYNEEDDDEPEVEESSDSNTDDSTDEDEAIPGDGAQQGGHEDDENRWRYPYWQSMTKKKMKTKISKINKYAAEFGIWCPGKKAVRHRMKLRLGKARRTKPKNKAKSRKYQLESFDHQNCKKCLADCTSRVHPNLTIKDTVIGIVGPYKLSMPCLKRYSDLRAKVIKDDPELDSQQTGSQDDFSTHKISLKTWIFMPSSGRTKTGCFNLYHSMLGPKSQEDTAEVAKSYTQIIVVQPQEFEEYHKAWGRRIAILQLPPSMKDDEGLDVSCSDGGIGYCRRFILKFAAFHGLSHIFMLDDNVLFVQEAQFENGKVVRMPYSQKVKKQGKVEGEKRRFKVKFKEVPLYKVLKHLEDQYNPDVAPPCFSFKPHPDCTPQSLEAFCGPSSNYAISGVRKNRANANIVQQVFAKVHVYSLVLLNIKSVSAKCISYEPMVAQEDLDFNAKCDQNGLWVVKFNRFILYKKNIKSNPSCYTWDDKAELKDNADLPDVPQEEEVKRLKLWIQNSLPPMAKHKICNTTCDSQTVTALFDAVNKIRSHSPVLFICLDPASAVKIALKRFLTTTPGIGGFGTHIIAISSVMCINTSLNRKEHFKSCFEECFEDGFIHEVITSHKIDEFRVTLVLVVIQGKILDPVDSEHTQIPGSKTGSKPLHASMAKTSESVRMKIQSPVTKWKRKNEDKSDEEKPSDDTPSKKVRKRSDDHSVHPSKAGKESCHGVETTEPQPSTSSQGHSTVSEHDDNSVYLLQDLRIARKSKFVRMQRNTKLKKSDEVFLKNGLDRPEEEKLLRTLDKCGIQHSEFWIGRGPKAIDTTAISEEVEDPNRRTQSKAIVSSSIDDTEPQPSTSAQGSTKASGDNENDVYELRDLKVQTMSQKCVITEKRLQKNTKLGKKDTIVLTQKCVITEKTLQKNTKLGKKDTIVLAPSGKRPNPKKLLRTLEKNNINSDNLNLKYQPRIDTSFNIPKEDET